MPDNCSVLDPWTVEYPYPAGVSEAAFARENDALARALRISLISNSAGAARAAVPSPESSSSLLFSTAGDHFRRRSPAAGRVAKKRKSRASKRSPTTYITADPANFREMVQRVTGTGSPHAAGLPLEPTALPPPEAPGAQGTRRLLPTFDTSAFLCDGEAGFLGSIGATVDGPVVTNFDPFFLVPSYPTLDSWGA